MSRGSFCWSVARPLRFVLRVAKWDLRRGSPRSPLFDRIVAGQPSSFFARRPRSARGILTLREPSYVCRRTGPLHPFHEVWHF